MVFFSNNYLDVTCTIWKKSESRKRARQANNILRRLYSNWEKGNKPIPLKELLRGVNTERLDIALSKRNYPQTFSLIRIQTNEKNGCRTAHLSDEYAFTAS